MIAECPLNLAHQRFDSGLSSVCPAQTQSRLLNVQPDGCNTQFLEVKRQERDRTQFSCRPKQIESSRVGIGRDPAGQPFQFIGETLLRRDHHDKPISRRLVQTSHEVPRRSPIGLIARKNRPTELYITHGTDTMVETGRYLEPALTELAVPIVLTGAMTPLGFEGSDGLQNLTESLLAVRLLSQGIYVVIHGQIFPVGRVRKDREQGRFVWTSREVAGAKKRVMSAASRAKIAKAAKRWAKIKAQAKKATS